MQVVAAIIVRPSLAPSVSEGAPALRNDQVLICQRKAGQRYAGKWEFPGGKVEPLEERKVALERELREELAIAATIGEEIASYEYTYPGRAPIQLAFYKVSEFEGEPRNLIFEQIRWEKIDNLSRYDFLDGDVDFVRTLTPESLSRFG